MEGQVSKGGYSTVSEYLRELIREAQRFRHLFGYACLLECPDAEIASGIAVLLQEPASIAQPEALEAWLGRAQILYGKYQEWYRQEHERLRPG